MSTTTRNIRSYPGDHWPDWAVDEWAAQLHSEDAHDEKGESVDGCQFCHPCELCGDNLTEAEREFDPTVHYACAVTAGWAD